MQTMTQIGIMVQDMTEIDRNTCAVGPKFWLEILESLQGRYTRLVLNAKFMSTCHQEEIKVQVIDILESLIGDV